ncbi:carboxypeptidase-like regulatory domain-containing protein [Chitinophaga pinensis]|uniref:Carboxypeptidase-like regulatory domain-containing protein n=1 Tax=Chitinophaga pinensis TaxID=79329 RepID=A0A5C6LKY7_9BACT|nr:carboxypeptidase-like regulatory domain-containing protein [Chitinophaga pinensis]TWV89186.1 carboxypeptidase-like regulatory domain-containing protein [Chitinophaga pinensis]
MKRIPTLAARLLLIKLLLFFGLLANAQNRIVRGKVTSADKGTTLANVTVLLKGGNTRTTTDATGNFSIQVPDDKAVLLFYLVDYTTREVQVSGKSTLDVSLELKNENLGKW